jgi:hypothetical protein
MYFIEIIKPKDGVISVFQKSTCSCPKFLKDYKCKHLLCLLYRKCHITISDEHKCVQFGKPRRRGRPRLNNPALMEQHIETQVDQEEHVLSDTEDEEDRVAKKQTKKKKASKRQVPDEVEPDFDIFSEEARRKSARISAI